jgi:hypothetical protein
MEALASRRAGSHTFGWLMARSLSGTLFHLAISANPHHLIVGPPSPR